jgi:hypothetical protein
MILMKYLLFVPWLLSSEAWMNAPLRRVDGTSTSALQATASMSRRSLLLQGLSFSFVLPTFAQDDDPLEELGKELSDSRWPLSPSPLPTSVRSAQELTAPRNESTAVSDLEKALQERSRKKLIEPRTHG